LKHLVDSNTFPELINAFSTKLHKSGKKNIANVLSVAMSTPKRVSKLIKMLSYHNKLKLVPYFPDYINVYMDINYHNEIKLFYLFI
jgi:hypothetical protein